MTGVVFALLVVLVISLVLGGIFVRDILTKQQQSVDHVATTVAEAVVAGIRGTLGYDQPIVLPDPGELSVDEQVPPSVPDVELDELFIPGSTEEFAMNQAGWMNAEHGARGSAGHTISGDAEPPTSPSGYATGEDR